jgi:hypothetical protein
MLAIPVWCPLLPQYRTNCCSAAIVRFVLPVTRKLAAETTSVL